MIRPIQYLRGLAAMMVVWHHSVGQIDATLQFIHVPPWGAYGVDLFFAISGFIMLVTTWDKPISPVEFIGHRIRRIVPLYWAATLLMVGIAILSPELFKTLRFDATSILKSLFFVPYWSLAQAGQIYPLLVPGWTLNYEMFFYALFALTLLMGKGRRVPVMVAALAGLVICGVIFHPTNPALQVYTNYRLLEFGAGMILGRIWVGRKHPRRDGGYPMLMALGDASYSIYLTHIFTLGLLRVVWVKLVPVASMSSSVALLVVSMALCAIAGWLCYRFVERPVTRWLGKHRLVIRIEALGEKA